MSLLGVFAFLLLLGHGATSDLETSKMAAHVANLRHYFKRQVFILTGPGPELHSLGMSAASFARRILKELAKYNIQTSETFLNASLFLNRRSPLFVLFETIVSVNQLLQLVPRQLLSSSKWIVYLKKGSRIKDVFRGVYIPFDCELVAVENLSAGLKATEVYRVAEGLPLRLPPLPPAPASAPTPLYLRRPHLHGCVLRVSTVHYPPMLVVKGNHISGYFGDIWNNISSAINCSSVFLSPNDSSWGKVGSDGKWNGMVGMLLRGEADLAVDAFSFTTSRLDVVAFSLPILETRISVFVGLRNTGDLRWETYVEPFSGKLWLAVVLCFVVLSFFMTLSYRLREEETNETGEQMFHNPVLSMFYASGMFCLQGLWTTPASLGVGVRVLLLTTYWLATLLLAAYSAFLVAALAVGKASLPFGDFADMLRLATYRLGIANTSGLLNMFDQSADPTMKSIYKKLILPGIGNLPDSTEDVVNRLCNSKYAYMRSQILGIVSDKPECNIIPITKSSIAETMGIVFPKSSPYKGIIDYQLLLHKEIGVFKRTANNIWPKVDVAEGPFEILGFNNVVAVFALLLVGMIASAFLLAMEYTTCSHIFNLHPRCHKEKYAIEACEETEEPENTESQLSDSDNQSS